MFVVKNWDVHFEGAKSKTYNNKTTCSIPTKHGLGYKMLVKKGGADCFGAWCALIQVLSRHHKPRAGCCTVDGTRIGRPYTSADLEVLTDIQSKVYDKMFAIVSSPEVDWVSVVNDCKDTTGNQTDTAGTYKVSSVPLNSDLDLDSNSDLDTNSNSRAKRGPLIVFGEFKKTKLSQDEYDKLCEKHGKEKADDGIQVLDSWLERTGKRRVNHYACLDAASFVWEKVGGATVDNRKSWTSGFGTGGL